ncbi:hypothetical protein [Geitlerinema sp. PCC 9228]|uniref:hypothetical protein n=1 Tax=Geitlerinema sp. PCC 9228 TaxID=111611 RepID=UPI001114BA41|nr:hypothetical protein [Geitlerinema sp. PCC 9228]
MIYTTHFLSMGVLLAILPFGIFSTEVSTFKTESSHVEESITTREVASKIAQSSSVYTIIIDSHNISGKTSYTIKNGGMLEQIEGKLDNYRVTAQSNDTVRGNTAIGEVSGGVDGFRAYGERPQIELSQPANARVYVKPGYTEEGYSHTIIIDSHDIPGLTSYTLKNGGRLEQVEGQLENFRVTAQSNDTVRDNTAIGEVDGGVDGFRVYGELPQIEITQPANAKVYINGQRRLISR